MKKRTKAENAAYSKQLRDKKKALRASSSGEPEQPEQPINYPDQYIKVALSPEPAPVCADCVPLRAEICRLNELMSTKAALEAARIGGLNTVIRDQAAEIVALQREVTAIRAASSNVRPPAAPNKPKVGTDDKEQQALFNRIMEAKINRFGRNVAIGSVR